MNHPSCAIAFLVLITPAILQAQQADSLNPTRYTLEEITITSERYPSRASDAPATVRSVSHAELDRRDAPDVVTVLAEIPGVQLDPVLGSGAGVSIQGLGSDRVLILLDGAPVAGRIGGEFDLTRIDPSQLSRIEVVEGPQSTLYGSSALGGVINLLTRADTGRRLELSSRLGSQDQLDARARLSGDLGAGAASLEFGRRSRDVVPGLSSSVTGDVRRWDAMARYRAPVAGGRLDARLLGIIDRQAYAARPDSPARNFNDNWQTDGLVSATLDGAGRTELRAHLSTYDHRFTRSETDTREDGAAPEWDRQRSADIELVRRGALGAHRWLLGAKAEREWLESPRIEGGSVAAFGGAAFASGEWHLAPSLALSTGARLTAAERWGTDVAPRIGLVASLPEGVYMKAVGARGFRAPSFKEQYQNFTNSEGPFTYTVKGNPDLVPEHSWNASAEVGRAAHGSRIYVRGFRNWLSNFIEVGLIDPATTTFSYSNVGAARTSGVEGGLTFTRGMVLLKASQAFLHTEDLESGEALLGLASATSRGSVTLMPGGGSVTGELVYSGDVPLRRSPSGSTTQEGYAHVNLSASVSLPGEFRVTGGVDNLFDTVPESAATFLGRRLHAGLTWGTPW